MLDWFKARVDWHDGLQNLSDTEAGRFAKALWKYVATNEEDSLTGKEQMMFAIAQGYLRREEENRQLVSDARREAGKLGGRPKKQSEAKKANGFFEKQKKAKKADKEEEQDIYTTTPLPPSSLDEDGGGGGGYESYISQNIPGMTVHHWDELRSYLEDGIDISVVHYAVDEAAAHGIRNWAYVRRVLDRCLMQGIATVEQAKISACAKTQEETAEEAKNKRESARTYAALKGEYKA